MSEDFDLDDFNMIDMRAKKSSLKLYRNLIRVN